MMKRSEYRAKQRTAKREAIPVIVLGFVVTAIAHPILIGWGGSLDRDVGLAVAVLGLMGPVLVFLGFIALYTYRENLDDEFVARNEERPAQQRADGPTA